MSDLFVRDRQKFSSDVQAFDMTCPWDKLILKRKNTETVESWLQSTVELLLLRRMCFLSKKPWKAKMFNASRELSESREDHEMPDYFWVLSFNQKFLDKNVWVLDNQI